LLHLLLQVWDQPRGESPAHVGAHLGQHFLIAGAARGLKPAFIGKARALMFDRPLRQKLAAKPFDIDQKRVEEIVDMLGAGGQFAGVRAFVFVFALGAVVLESLSRSVCTSESGATRHRQAEYFWPLFVAYEPAIFRPAHEFDRVR
jgi:hypothetical protein